MALVEGGTFLSGDENEPVTLPAFYMDVFPTTNDDYARFMRATGHPAPQHWVDGKPPGADLFEHPVVFVSWHDASAYASWAAKTLPTSRQWEKAARGTQGDVYPWGSQATPAKCNVREGGVRATTPVSRYHSGVSPYGIYDLCGNIWEWCSDGREADRYELKGSAFTSPFFRVHAIDVQRRGKHNDGRRHRLPLCHPGGDYASPDRPDRLIRLLHRPRSRTTSRPHLDRLRPPAGRSAEHPIGARGLSTGHICRPRAARDAEEHCTLGRCPPVRRQVVVRDMSVHHAGQTTYVRHLCRHRHLPASPSCAPRTPARRIVVPACLAPSTRSTKVGEPPEQQR